MGLANVLIVMEELKNISFWTYFLMENDIFGPTFFLNDILDILIFLNRFIQNNELRRRREQR